MFKPVEEKDALSERQVSALSEEPSQQEGGRGPVDYTRVIQQANRIFGYGNWDRRIEEGSLVNESVSDEESKNPVYHFFYTVKVQVVVQPQSDNESSVREAIGVGHGFDADPGRAYELAVERAEESATIKAFETYGPQFGLGAGLDLPGPEASGIQADLGTMQIVSINNN